jgi:hypothetical protein
MRRGAVSSKDIEQRNSSHTQFCQSEVRKGLGDANALVNHKNLSAVHSFRYFDFVECFGLTLLSMGTIAVEQRESRLGTSPTKSILPLHTAEIETTPWVANS